MILIHTQNWNGGYETKTSVKTLALISIMACLQKKNGKKKNKDDVCG